MTSSSHDSSTDPGPEQGLTSDLGPGGVNTPVLTVGMQLNRPRSALLAFSPPPPPPPPPGSFSSHFSTMRFSYHLSGPLGPKPCGSPHRTGEWTTGSRQSLGMSPRCSAGNRETDQDWSRTSQLDLVLDQLELVGVGPGPATAGWCWSGTRSTWVVLVQDQPELDVCCCVCPVVVHCSLV